jgi:DNA-binding SARP family transcriptional activator
MFKLRRLFHAVLDMPVYDVNRYVLQTRSHGYALLADPDQLDITEFDLRRSLALRRGQIVHTGQCDTVLRAHAARLEERRFYAHTTRIDADLCLSRHREMIPELASLVVEHPLHEPVHAMLMLALYRAGRASAALELFLRFRGRMLHELAMTPSDRIRALHMALLSADPALANRSLTSETLLDHLAAQR